MTNRVWWLGFALLASACGDDPACSGGLEYDRAERRCVCPRGSEYVCTTENDCECVALGDAGGNADAGTLVDSGTPDTETGDAGRTPGSCAEGETTCGGDCVDTQRDELHCGRCGVQCEARELCSEGVCIDPVVSIAAGNHHACVARALGSVWCWGNGRDGQMGHGAVGDFPTPVQVATLGAVSEVSASPRFAFDATASSFTCARRADGSVWCWGTNESGQLGDGTTEQRSSPVRVMGLPMPARTVVAGGETVCALLTDRSVHCWGSNGTGLLGTGVASTDPQLSPTRVPDLSEVASAELTFGFGGALTTEGRAFFWGGNPTSEAPLGPTAVPGLMGATVLAGNGYGLCGLLGTEAWCFGVGYARGIDDDGGFVGTPEPVVGLGRGVRGLAGGSENLCAITDDGVVCWGRRDLVAYGDSGMVVTAIPPHVVPNTRGATHVAVGTTFACAVIDGRSYCWGSNDYGQLGDGSTARSGVPVRVVGLFD